MNNYLKSKVILVIFACVFCASTPEALSAEPNHDANTITINTRNSESVLLDNYIAAAKKQFERLSKNIPGINKGEREKQNTEKQTDSLSALKNSLTSSVRNLYDSEHPEKLFSKLIAGYSFYLYLEGQILKYGEPLLGKDNQIILQIQKNHKSHVEYLESLKQQKLLLSKQENKSLENNGSARPRQQP